MVVYACNSSIWEGEAEYHELEATLKDCIITKQINNTNKKGVRSDFLAVSAFGISR